MNERNHKRPQASIQCTTRMEKQVILSSPSKISETRGLYAIQTAHQIFTPRKNAFWQLLKRNPITPLLLLLLLLKHWNDGRKCSCTEKLKYSESSHIDNPIQGKIMETRKSRDYTKLEPREGPQQSFKQHKKCTWVISKLHRRLTKSG